LLSRRVTNDPEARGAIFAELGGEAKVALEAAFGWEWLADLLEGEGIELHLAHSRHTKAIAAARVKTDAVDARKGVVSFSWRAPETAWLSGKRGSSP
jgi:transposase